jgi:hypothetical protein
LAHTENQSEIDVRQCLYRKDFCEPLSPYDKQLIPVWKNGHASAIANVGIDAMKPKRAALYVRVSTDGQTPPRTSASCSKRWPSGADGAW